MGSAWPDLVQNGPESLELSLSLLVEGSRRVPKGVQNGVQSEGPPGGVLDRLGVILHTYGVRMGPGWGPEWVQKWSVLGSWGPKPLS